MNKEHRLRLKKELEKKLLEECRLKEEKKKNENELKLKQNYIKDIPKYLESIEKETNKTKKNKIRKK